MKRLALIYISFCDHHDLEGKIIEFFLRECPDVHRWCHDSRHYRTCSAESIGAIDLCAILIVWPLVIHVYHCVDNDKPGGMTIWLNMSFTVCFWLRQGFIRPQIARHHTFTCGQISLFIIEPIIPCY
jgi:hypothetical protein